MCTFKKGETGPPTPLRCTGAYYARVLLTTQFLTFNRLNSQYNSPKLKANKKKVLQCLVWSNTLSNSPLKILTNDVIENAYDVITLI